MPVGAPDAGHVSRGCPGVTTQLGGGLASLPVRRALWHRLSRPDATSCGPAKNP